jgi:hypothetical protein
MLSLEMPKFEMVKLMIVLFHLPAYNVLPAFSSQASLKAHNARVCFRRIAQPEQDYGPLLKFQIRRLWAHLLPLLKSWPL